MSQPLLNEERLRRLFAMQWRVLSFRFESKDLRSFTGEHLIFGLIATWLAGLGRYWDHPDPYWVQQIGIGSLAIVATLSLLVYVVVLPLRPRNWGLVNLATFITLTALPALLYAIPVERFLDVRLARMANVLFLGSIAAWRVGLLGTYLRRRAEFSRWLSAVALLLPVAGIVTALTVLNLERAVFNVMAGLREDATPADTSYFALFLLTALAIFSFPALLIAYLAAIFVRRRARRTT